MKLKISICIPQYNRIDFLLISLNKLAKQTYTNFEVIVSDDCSSDQTEEKILKYKETSSYPITYHRFEQNQGYDRNLRNSIELATGDYCIILGNDDTLNNDDDLQKLVDFLEGNDLPDIGFCNSIDYINHDDISIRAKESKVFGSGIDIALKYYSSFSFVAGIIVKKSAFDEVNTSAYDKSIYVQIYLAVKIILKGGKFFTISDLFIQKDIRVDGSKANSYLDTLPRKWKEYKDLDAGLPSYVNVTLSAFKDLGLLQSKYIVKIISRIYGVTYPYWILNYKENGAFVAAVGLFNGLSLKSFKTYYSELPFLYKLRIALTYYIATILAFIMPVFLFNFIKKQLYGLVK